MKVLLITASLLIAMNAMACGGKDKDEEKKDQRTSVIR